MRSNGKGFLTEENAAPAKNHQCDVIPDGCILVGNLPRLLRASQRKITGRNRFQNRPSALRRASTEENCNVWVCSRPGSTGKSSPRGKKGHVLEGMRLQGHCVQSNALFQFLPDTTSDSSVKKSFRSCFVGLKTFPLFLASMS